MENKTPNFLENVLDLVRQIPKGRVCSYGVIAKFLGKPRGARMVGWVMNQCVGKDDVPAHRVVNRNGLLTGRHHFETPTRMQELLESEGVEIKDDQIHDFGSIFWNPEEELL